MIRDEVAVVTTGNAPQRGVIGRISRYGIGGFFILPSRPVSVRVRGLERPELLATPRGGVTGRDRAVRRAAMEATLDPPGGRADRTLWFARR